MRIINEIPYALLHNIDKPGIYNLLTNKIVLKTPRAQSFAASESDLFFFRFPNKYLSQINPQTSELISHTPVSLSPGQDQIFIFKTTIAILYHNKDNIVFSNGREDQYYAPNFDNFQPNLENSIQIQNFVFCSNCIIEFDVENSFFQAKSYEKNQGEIIEKLKENFQINHIFYNENNEIMINEMKQIAIFFDLEFWWEGQQLYFEIFDLLFDEEIVYKSTKTEIRYMMEQGVKNLMNVEDNLSSSQSQLSQLNSKSVKKLDMLQIDRLLENSDSVSILREEDEDIVIKTLDQDIISPPLKTLSLQDQYIKNLENIKKFDLVEAVDRISKTGISVELGADNLFQEMIKFLNG
eukprot:EST45247.1 Hypothetical protein SS50377_14823 [Spironucleus salmonicida]